MDSVEAIISAAGGVTKVARALGVDHSTVCEWKRNQAFPFSRTVQISTALDVPLDVVSRFARDPRLPAEAA